MNITSILTDLRQRNIAVRVKGNDLSVVAERGVMSPETKTILAKHKQAIVSYLRRLEQAEVCEIQVVDRSSHVPLSLGQRWLWLSAQLEPPSSAYVIPAAVRINGRLQPSLLNQALNMIVDRHEVLRTVFKTEDGEPRQEILSEMAVPFSFIDLMHNSPTDRETKLEECIRCEMSKPFDLAVGPLLRATIVQIEEQEHILVLALHCIVADVWSISILMRELSVFYAASQNGRPADLPTLPVQYADYAAWQRRWNESAARTRQLAYWEQQLAGLAPLALPTDHPRQHSRTPRSGSSAFAISGQLVERLRSLALQEDATLFMVLLGAFQILLSRYSGQQQIAVGTQVANRERKEIEDLIGFFANTLVLWLQVEGLPTFRQILSQIRKTVLDAFENQDLPFEELVDELQPERNFNRNPLFQAMFILQNTPRAELHLGEIKLRPFDVANPTARFDLTLSLAEKSAGLQGWLSYNTELFEPATVTRIIGHYCMLLQRIVEQPEQRVSEISLFTEAELSQLQKWNQTAAEYPQKFVHELFEEHAAKTPAAFAVDFEGQQLTYEQLNRRANQLGRYLKKLGAEPDARVGICMERSLEMVIGLLAILKAGAAYVPLDPEYPADRLSFMSEEAKVRVILIQEKLAARFSNCTATLVKVDQEWERISREATDNLEIVVEPENLAYVIYTSGSTGRPKGAMNTHHGLRNRILWMQEKYHLCPNDRVLQKTRYSFDVSAWEFFWPLVVGAGLVVAQPGGHSDPHYLGTVIRQKKVSTLHFVPSMLAAFLEAGAAQQCESVRRVICSGEALSPELARRCMEEMTAELHNLYGPTEASIDVTCYHCTSEGIKNGVPIGKPIANTEIHILDNLGHPVPVLVAGELYICGAGVARGYVGRPDLTAERFVPDYVSGRRGAQLYRTGDKARWRADGNVEYLGRFDNQVKIRGYRIELGEVEAVLMQHPAVGQAVVVVCEDQPGEMRLVAYYTRAAAEKEAQPVGTEQLRAHLEQRLPGYMVPGAYMWLEKLPLTPNGKLDRKALPRPEWKGDEKEYVAPRNAVEEELSRIWGEVLGVKRVGIRDNFFQLGGDSIISIQILARCREAGLKLELQQLIQQQTIERLAPLVSGIEEEDEGGGGEPFSLIGAEDRSKVPQGVEDAYPLSRLQAGMLFHSEFNEKTPLYHVIRSIHLRAPLDAEVLRQAVAELVERHEVLRTSFHLSGDSQPLQWVHRRAEIEVEVEDLRHLGTEEQEEILQEWMEVEKRRRFDVSHAGLLRFHVHRKTEESFQFWLTHHHVILDGWSLASLLTELFGCYLELLKGKWVKRKKLSRHFREFIEAELKVVKSEEARGFWAEQLREMEIANLPWEKQRTAEGEMRTLAVPIEADTSEALNGWARQMGVSLKSVLLAAHVRVLNLISGQTDVITGMTSDGRVERREGEQVLGLFLNSLPFRMRLRGGSWKDLVQETAEQEAALLPYRRYPLVDIQMLAGRTSLFDVTFNFIHFHIYREIERTGVEVLGGMPFAFTNFTLSADFSLHPVLSTLQLVLEHSSLLVTEEQIQSIAGYYQNVLNQMVRYPDARYEITCLLSEAERQQLAVEWNRTAVEYPKQTVVELFERKADETPEAVAIEYTDEQLTYATLNARANQLARYLEKLRVGPETAVGICMERSLEMFVALLGIMKAGAVYVPLDPGYPADRLRFMAEDAALKRTLVHDMTMDIAPHAVGNVVNLSRDTQLISQEQDSNVPLKNHPENLAYIIYTSGSTGKPKGVGISYGSMYNQLCWATQAFQISAKDRFLQKASVGFDSSIEEILTPLVAGACIIATKPRGEYDVQYLAELVGSQGVSCIDLSPSLLQAFVDYPDAAVWRSVRLVISGGEALKPELVKSFYKRFSGTLLNTYGPTEATVQCAWADDLQPGESVPIGRPVANTQLFALNEHFDPVPLGVGGELCIGGAGLGRGYINRAALTAEKFIPDPFSGSGGGRLYRTGDLVKWRNDGQLDFVGRRDYQVKLRGYRIELGEIENAIESQPEVKQAVVVVQEDLPDVQGPGEKRLVGYVVSYDGQRLSEATLRRELKQRLPGFMMPATLVMLEKLPLTPSGKVDRKRLPDPELKAGANETEYVSPRNITEEILCGIWEDILKRERIGIFSNFFELGGHSLLAAQAVARISDALHVDLPLRRLFEAPTVAELAHIIEQLRTVGDTEEIPTFAAAPRD